MEPYDGIGKTSREETLLIYYVISISRGADWILYAPNVTETDSWLSLYPYTSAFTSTLSRKLNGKLSPMIKSAKKTTFVALQSTPMNNAG